MVLGLSIALVSEQGGETVFYNLPFFFLSSSFLSLSGVLVLG